MPRSAAHIFLVHGDIRRIACDGWLMPCGPTFVHEADSWYPEYKDRWQARPGKIYADGRVARVQSWPPPGGAPSLSEPWLVDVVGDEQPIDYFVERALLFIEVASRWLKKHPESIRLTRRSRPLLALPLVGTGGGGAAYRAGDMAAALLPALQAKATQCGVDVALVLLHASKYAATVRVREQTLGEDPRKWPVALSEQEYHALEELADWARKGQLVLFIGAGVSIGAGLPSWDGLLTQLAVDENILPPNDPDFRDRFHKLNPLDRARVIEMELLRRDETIADALGRILHAHPNPSLAHCLLAMLPCDEAVTTNYDELFEIACQGNGRPVAALPWEAVSEKSRWVLKLHGSLDHPDDLVFTRSDYLRYDERRAALKGIVQAMLMTRMMLFVGFSMNDDNFHRIIDDVRKARVHAPLSEQARLARDENSPAMHGSRRFGASLGLRDDPVFERLWGQDLKQISVEDRNCPGAEDPAARRLEIFLDALAQKSAAANAHLLDQRFDAILSEHERRLRDLLIELDAQADEGVRATRTWPLVEDLLRTLGGGTRHVPSDED